MKESAQVKFVDIHFILWKMNLFSLSDPALKWCDSFETFSLYVSHCSFEHFEDGVKRKLEENDIHHLVMFLKHWLFGVSADFRIWQDLEE